MRTTHPFFTGKSTNNLIFNTYFSKCVSIRCLDPPLENSEALNFTPSTSPPTVQPPGTSPPEKSVTSRASKPQYFCTTWGSRWQAYNMSPENPMGWKMYMDVSKNRGKTPKSSIFNTDFHYKPSILGYHYFWKHPYISYWNSPFLGSMLVFGLKMNKGPWVK